MPEQKEKPRCYNCSHWRSFNQAFGQCSEPNTRVFVDEAIVRHVEKMRITTDYTVCSLWAGKAN